MWKVSHPIKTETPIEIKTGDKDGDTHDFSAGKPAYP